MDKSIHVILGIDMETDCGHNTPFYEGVQKATPVLLDIFEKKGVKTTFYFTGDAARQNPARRSDSMPAAATARSTRSSAAWQAAPTLR